MENKKEFKINGATVEYSKKDLEGILKEFDKPKYELKLKNIIYCNLSLKFYIDGVLVETLSFDKENNIKLKINFWNDFMYNIAKEIGQLLSDEELMNGDVLGCGMGFVDDYSQLRTCETDANKIEYSAYFKNEKWFRINIAPLFTDEIKNAITKTFRGEDYE